MAFNIFILYLFATTTALQKMKEFPLPSDKHYSMNINMPDVKPHKPDAYLCTARKLNNHESYIVQYEPDTDSNTAHHMLLFGCRNLQSKNQLYPKYWNCAHSNLCNEMNIMYGWAKNAPAMSLPPNVGFLIGGNSSIHYIVLQIHYAKPLPDGVTDNSGLKLHITTQRQKYITGIRLLFAESAQIPPRQPQYHVDVNCKYNEDYIIHPFAYRVHTHKLGVVVTGYSFNMLNNSWTFLAKGNPQWPQAFYPMHELHTITNNDVLSARCTYNSSEVDVPVNIGSSSTDEMCNLYIMYYTEYQNYLFGQSSLCIGVEYWKLVENLPPGNDIPLPRNPEMEQRAFGAIHHHQNPIIYNNFENQKQPSLVTSNLGSKTKEPLFDNQCNEDYTYQEVHGWPSRTLKFGQIAAVTVDHDGNIAIFHRGNHVWNDLTFDLVTNKYLPKSEGPISIPTVVILDSVTGLILKQWGNDLFYMPHGLFISRDGSFWVTDVALHQVFKFSPNKWKQPALSLGTRFIPGTDKFHFCKPASVTVSRNGDIYVADGYCNSRIMRFSSEGKFLSQWGKQDNAFENSPPVGSFRIPHKVILLEDRNLVCVADRENGRIQCFTMETGRFRFQIQREEFGGTLYSIAYSEEKGLLFAVCGESIYRDHLVRAFVFNITDQKLLNMFAPQTGTFTRPHDIAVLPNGDEAYVCEIGPNVVWKFNRVYHKSTKKVLDIHEFKPHVSTSENEVGQAQIVALSVNKIYQNSTLVVEEEFTNFETSMIIMSLLAIPVLCLVLVTIIIRLKRRGKLQNCNCGQLKGWWGGYRSPQAQDKFNIGNLLNPHKGFDRVSVEESDIDGDDGSDSDMDEFNSMTKKT